MAYTALAKLQWLDHPRPNLMNVYEYIRAAGASGISIWPAA